MEYIRQIPEDKKEGPFETKVLENCPKKEGLLLPEVLPGHKSFIFQICQMNKRNKSDKSQRTKIRDIENCRKKERGCFYLRFWQDFCFQWPLFLKLLPEVLTLTLDFFTWGFDRTQELDFITRLSDKLLNFSCGKVQWRTDGERYENYVIISHARLFFMAKKWAVIVILLHNMSLTLLLLFLVRNDLTISRSMWPLPWLSGWLSGPKITTNAGGGWRVMERWRNYGGRLPTQLMASR